MSELCACTRLRGAVSGRVAAGGARCPGASRLTRGGRAVHAQIYALSFRHTHKYARGNTRTSTCKYMRCACRYHVSVSCGMRGLARCGGDLCCRSSVVHVSVTSRLVRMSVFCCMTGPNSELALNPRAAITRPKIRLEIAFPPRTAAGATPRVTLPSFRTCRGTPWGSAYASTPARACAVCTGDRAR